MGNNHPAFTFEQRNLLGELLSRIKAHLQRFRHSKNYPIPPTYMNPQGYDPNLKYCYYLQYVPQVPVPPVGGGVGNLSGGPTSLSSVDISRLPPQQLGYTFPQYSQYPLFVQAHNQPPHTPIIQPQVLGKTSMGATLNSKPPTLQQSISLDGGWTPKKIGKEKGMGTELDQQTAQMNDLSISLERERERSRQGCFNCGSQSHMGQECKEQTIGDATKYFYRINYSSSSAESS